MAIDDVPRSEHIEVRQSSGPWVLVFVVLGLLVLGEVYSFTKLGSIGTVQTQQASLQKQVQDSRDQLASKLSSLEDANAQQLDALRSELDTTSKRMGSSGNALARAKKMVNQLQEKTQAENDQLKQELNQEISKKADTEQVNAVSQDVASTKTDLGSTKQNLDTLKNDLGMARSEMGTLIARNHDDIETLRKLGERNYYEFTAMKNQEQKAGGVGIVLKKTNVKKHAFNLNLLTNDMQIQKNGRTVDEPIFFSAGGSKSFYELVINKVSQDKVSGYISSPKFSQPELAAAATPAGR